MSKKLLFTVLLIALLMPAHKVSARRDILPGPVQGQVLKILDGDTLQVRLHVWIGQDLETLVRIAGIDTPEIKGKCNFERQKAIKARDHLSKLLPENRVELRNIRLEKYAGRVMADVHSLNGTSAAESLVSQGLARPYQGKKRQSWCN
jgi:micrococcal nuclease